METAIEKKQIPTYGKENPYLGSEDNFQTAIARYLDYQNILWCAVPNGGKRNKAEAAKLKRTGTKAGFPDLAIFEAVGGYNGLMIELKVKKGKVRPNQIEWLTRLQERGFKVAVCYNIDSVMELVQNYFSKIKKS